ncbi:glycoside hydrolase family 99-like domain-containing protein [Roseovarius sp. C7]|uniref:glycoside hydrolase family 99-like domain-containing protein n=1 Tax=Roseovarius sp. C7 TaxID=3398643 RepID=UPI0039F7353B
MGRVHFRRARLGKALQLIFPPRHLRRYARMIGRKGAFDARFYRREYPDLHWACRLWARRHYVTWGEQMGHRPMPEFSPVEYLRLNPDVAHSGIPPLMHFLSSGRGEGRSGQPRGSAKPLPGFTMPRLRFDPDRPRARFALHAHIYYPDLWPEFATRLAEIGDGLDLYITLTWRGDETRWLCDEIAERFPRAFITPVPNRGRDILPFLLLANAGAFDGYEALCKIHTKKSPHRDDGDRWRRHLIDGILPAKGLWQDLERFLGDDRAAFWVADGQAYAARDWWGINRDKTGALLRRVELEKLLDDLRFPAGSIYWMKPLMLGMIKSLRLDAPMFEPEQGQIDGTLAHAVERAIGGLALAAGQHIRETSELRTLARAACATPVAPSYVSAFYLPQFHPIPENDAWWGQGFTEWRGVVDAASAYPGHLQPMRPADLGYYDLRATEVMGDQAALARDAGVDGFCVYHYWFDGRRVLEQPLDRLLARPEVDFPFYLCWANESWRRNWDGLSGEVLLDQSYAPGFEAALVASTLPYMRDPRYQRPDGLRPRFVIYRPEDMPAPDQNVARLRRAWAEAGIGPVELGAVSFHVGGKSPVDPALFEFWVEMPPHGLVKGEDYIFGGSAGNRMGACGPAAGFAGLIYDYRSVAERSLTRRYRAGLPPNTIAGIMPGWDNSARRGARAHIAHGANPASFRKWLRGLCDGPLEQSYRGELFINAWNEWAEKAMLEPSARFGRLNLDVLAEATGGRRAALPDRGRAHG